MKTIKSISHLLRIHQWIKNLVVFVPMVHWHYEFDIPTNLILCFFSFALASSAVYVYNDLKDKESDQNHPQKKYRPLASGAISTSTAIWLITSLGLISLYTAYQINLYCVGSIVAYWIINLLYSNSWKHVPIIDTACISFGFVLRALCGYFAINSQADPGIILIVFCLTFGLGNLKRLSELISNPLAAQSRPALKNLHPNSVGAIAVSNLTLSSVFITQKITNISDYHIYLMPILIILFALLIKDAYHGEGQDLSRHLLKSPQYIGLGLILIAVVTLLTIYTH